MSWDSCVVVRGDSREHLPWNNGQFGSNTSFTMTRTNFAAAMRRGREAQGDRGAGSRRRTCGLRASATRPCSCAPSPRRRLSYAAAAQRAIDLGGKFDGHEVPAELNAMTKASAAGVAGTGLIGVAKDPLPRTGTVPALAAGFVEIELDVETGKYTIVDYLGVADCGTVLHPQGLARADEERRDHGHRARDVGAAHLRPAERAARRRRALAGEAAVLPRCAGRDGDRRGRDRRTRRTRSARRASASRCRAARRPRCSARSPTRSAGTLQPHARGHGHDRERGCRAAAVAQAAAGQYRMKWGHSGFSPRPPGGGGPRKSGMSPFFVARALSLRGRGFSPSISCTTADTRTGRGRIHGG